MEVGGNVDMKNTVALRTPFFVEQQARTLERWSRSGKHHGAGQTFNGSMSVDRFWQEFGGNVLWHGEHHPVMGVVFFTDTNAGCRHLLNRRVQYGGGRSKPVEQLLWHRLNALFGHHHRAVRHGPQVKSAKANRSEREGSSVIPANSGSRTRLVVGRNRRLFSPWTMVGDGVSIARSKSFEEVAIRHLKNRNPSRMPTDLSVGSR